MWISIQTHWELFSITIYNTLQPWISFLLKYNRSFYVHRSSFFLTFRTFSIIFSFTSLSALLYSIFLSIDINTSINISTSGEFHTMREKHFKPTAKCQNPKIHKRKGRISDPFPSLLSKKCKKKKKLLPIIWFYKIKNK